MNSVSLGDIAQLGATAIMLWVLFRSVKKDSAERDTKFTNGLHGIDLRLRSIETTVSPYALQMSRLSDSQAVNMKDIAELKANAAAHEKDIARMNRELETLRNQQKRG